MFVFLALAACGHPPDDATHRDTGGEVPPKVADLSSLELSQGTLAPPFRPGVHHYAVAADDLDEAVTTIGAEADNPDAAIAITHASMDGVVDESGPPPLKATLGPAERIEVTVTLGEQTETYSIVSVPDSFPRLDVRVASDDAWDGYVFLANIPNGSATAVPPSYAFILDRTGTPVWFRETAGSTLDFKVNPTGELSYITFEDTGFKGYVLDDAYATARNLQPVGLAMDQRELDVLPNGGAIVFGTALRKADLSAYGGAAGCCTVKDFTIQEIDPGGNVAFEWKGADHMDEFLLDLPQSILHDLHDNVDYSHINAVDIDPADGNWIVSSRHTSHVFKVARVETTFHGVTHAPGDIVWKLGGLDSDWTFVDDERAGGWSGFGFQHEARMVAPDRLTVYDNSTWPDIGALGDSRYVEYELDATAMTATKVAEYAEAGAGPTEICGSAERLPNGSTIIGWGALSETTPGAPAVTEVTADGTVVLEIGLPAGQLSYRAGVGVWDLEDGWAVP